MGWIIVGDYRVKNNRSNIILTQFMMWHHKRVFEIIIVAMYIFSTFTKTKNNFANH